MSDENENDDVENEYTDDQEHEEEYESEDDDDEGEPSEEDEDEDDPDDMDAEVQRLLEGGIDADIDPDEIEKTEEDSDDDDKTDDVKDADDEDDDDEDKDEDEEPTLLDELLEQDQKNKAEEEEEESLDIDEVTDDMIVKAMYTTQDWGEYLALQKEENIPIDETFVAEAARNGIDPQFLMDNGIHNLETYHTYTQELAKKADPDAVIVPSEDDEKAWEEFSETVLLIPKTPEEYDENIFDKTWLDEDGFEEDQAEMREWMHKVKLDQNQAQLVLDKFQESREVLDEQSVEDKKSYRLEQERDLKEYFGEDYKDIMRNNAAFLSKFGQEFIKEFKGDNPLYSRALHMLLYNAMNDLEAPESIKWGRAVKGLTGYSVEKLQKLEEKMLESKFMDEKYANDPSKKVRNEYKKHVVRMKAVQRELEKRGVDSQE